MRTEIEIERVWLRKTKPKGSIAVRLDALAVIGVFEVPATRGPDHKHKYVLVGFQNVGDPVERGFTICRGDLSYCESQMNAILDRPSS